MADKFIIVKYGEQHYPDKIAPMAASVAYSYSWICLGLTKEFYTSEEEAAQDLQMLVDFNPTVYYSVVRAEE